jgi:DNA-binding response OmpR family regulator
LVEDDSASRKAVQAIMTRQGWEVLATSRLAEGRKFLDLGTDVLILDLMLPDGDGMSLLQLIRDENRPVRVIVTTGSMDSAKIDAVLRLNPESLLVKPIDLELLLHAVGKPF